MGNSWKYAQKFQFPQSDLCECGHYRSEHAESLSYPQRRIFCIKCMDYGKEKDITDSPPDNVIRSLLREKEKCEKFRHWSTERVRKFWNVANIVLFSEINKKQTIIDDYL